jgi:hypothetical protein
LSWWCLWCCPPLWRWEIICGENNYLKFWNCLLKIQNLYLIKCSMNRMSKISKKKKLASKTVKILPSNVKNVS